MGKVLPTPLFTFDDVLILPARSALEPREASLRAVLVTGITIEMPFLSAAMDRVTEPALAIALHHAGGLGILHRNCATEQQTGMVKQVKAAGARVGAACGPFDSERATALKESGVDVLVIDCAHGHNAKVIASTRAIRERVGRLPIIVGNIATAEAAKDLAGVADAVKVGVGPGSICTTRIVSGVGVPQLSAILDVAHAAHAYGMTVIADGGMRTSGDIAKALAAGADAVMLGNVFARAREAPGTVVERAGVLYKEYRGMGSKAVLESRMSSDRYLVSGRKAVPEGVEGLVPCGESVADIVAELASGIQVAMGYVGAANLADFRSNARFVPITQASREESRPHSLVIASE